MWVRLWGVIGACRGGREERRRGGGGGGGGLEKWNRTSSDRNSSRKRN